MALTRWPSPPDPRLLPWAIWRFRGAVPADKPPWPLNKKIPLYWWEFLKWAGWRRKGGKPPRPDVIEKIPQWAWGHLRDLAIAVPLTPPPPPPPGPGPIPLNSWNLPYPLVYTAWGWASDSDFRNVDPIAQIMASSGVRTVGMQGGIAEPGVAQRLKRDYGFQIFLWGHADSRDQRWLGELEADGYEPQVEGRYEFDAAIANLEAGVGRGLSLSIVSTLSGLETYTRRPDGTEDGESTTVEVERLIDVGCTHVNVECYTGNMEPLSVDHFMQYSAIHRGIYHSHPVVGLARQHVTFATYLATGLGRYGRQVGAYIAEGMIRPRDWDDLRAL